MGKRDKRKTKEKSAKNKDKEKQKQKKKELKNAKASNEPEEDIDAILQAFQKEQEEQYKVTEESNAPHPSRRCNATFVANPTNSNELLLFGGEYYDGQKVQLFNDFFRYNIEKKEWRRITSPNSPGPRCSHQMVITPTEQLFLFGGEFASPTESTFFHYKDFWMLDLKTNKWDKLEMRIRPSPRSGHRMVQWKQFLVLFGGFYDTNFETKYFDDLWIFDLTTHNWKKLELQEPKPTARSGFQFISHPTSDFIVLYGGYSKQYVKGQKTQGVTHTDMWALKMSTDEKAIKWERRKKGGMTPTIRSGCTMTAFKNRAVLFGGVTDMVEEDDHIQSMCHNDMYIYALETNKWYPFTLRQPKAKKTKAPTPQRKDDFDDAETEDRRNAEDDEDDFGEDLDTVVNSSQMGDFKGKQVEEGEEREVLNAFSPCPRFNAMMAVQKNVLYIFGGIFESADREYTLNDLWALNLDKAQAFECLKADDLRQVGWLGENSDDDDDDDEEDDDDENESDEDSEEEVEDSQTLGSNVVAEQVEEKDDGPIAACPEEEPLVNETLKDYYARTTVYWQRKAMEEGEERNQVGKSLRRDAFQICQDNWSAWQPKLREVAKRMQDDEAGEVTAKKAGSSAESKLRHRG